MQITKYSIKSEKISSNITIACVSDVHARKFKRIIKKIKLLSPDIILLAGDILEVSNEYMKKRNATAFDFLRQISNIAPVYYCFGNHEIYYSHARKEKDRMPDDQMLKENIENISSLGINLVNDTYCKVCLKNGENIFIGGLVCGMDMCPDLNITDLNIDFLKVFDKVEYFKILLCHYPHYYDKYLRNTSFDLIVSGHAHGGQWRIFNKGIYAPHQGIFPKYTSGMLDNRFIISRGAVNNSKPIPRFFNPTEILKIEIKNK